MDIDLNEVAVFVKVVQTGSFTQAAKQLGMPNSTVSAKVANLEERLGVTLIQRTTRKISITPVGRAFFNRCSQGLEEIQGAELEVSTSQSEPQGVLRLTAPVELGASLLPQAVMEFSKRYQKATVELILTDRTIDLIAEGVDLAIRTGVLKDSTLIARKLGNIHFGLYVSPQYLKSKAKIATPKDLREHECLIFTPLKDEGVKLTGPKGAVTVPIEGRLILNDLYMIKSLAVTGAGPALLPSSLCYPEVKAGHLVRILPDWRSNTRPVHFVYPEQKFIPPKMSAFISMAAEMISKRLRELEL